MGSRFTLKNFFKSFVLLVLLLNQIVLADESSQFLNNFNLGVINHQQKNYPLAIDFYNKAISIGGSLTPVAWYYLAQIKLATGEKAEAQTIVSKISMDTIPENLKKQVLLFKNNLYVTVPAVNVAPEKDEQSLFLSAEIESALVQNPSEIANSSSTKINSEINHELRVYSTFVAFQNNHADSNISYSYSSQNYVETTDLNYSSHTLSAPFSFYFDALKLKIVPEYFVDNSSNILFSESKGVSSTFTKKIDSIYISINSLYTAITNKTTDYAYLTGTETKLGFLINKNWSNETAQSSLTLSLSARQFRYKDTNTVAASYVSQPISLTYQFCDSDFECTLSVSYENKKYIKLSNPTPARNDIKTSADFKLSYDIDDYFKIFSGLNYTKNISNYNTVNNDYNYSQSQVSLGLGFDY